MNSSLLHFQSEEQFEQSNILDSNLLINNNTSIFNNESNEEEFPFLLSEEKNVDNGQFESPLYPFEKLDFLNKNKAQNFIFPTFDNKISEKAQNINFYEEPNSFGNLNEYDNSSCINITPLSILTTSNDNLNNNINNIGVKNDDFIFESKNDTKNAKNEGDASDQIFKCDFLQNISKILDENDDNNIYYYNNKKDKIDLNNPKSLLAAIINLMKEKGPIDIKTIISCLESKKDSFRKANGSKYKQDFNKLVKISLNTPDIFYKTEEGNKYFFIENKTEYYLKKKRERAMEKIFSNLKKKNNICIPINIKIQLDKVNLIIKKMEKKYKGDKKYVNVMICVDMFKSLIKKYLYLVKMDKVNSLYELSVLNEKIIDICHTLEKIEKGEIFFKSNENIFVKKANEYNKQNYKNINFVDGKNNYFNEPPNNL